MWRKYAERYFGRMANSFFVSIDDLGLSTEDMETLRSQVDSPHKLGLQLMRNIVNEILAKIEQDGKIILKYAPATYDAFFSSEFNELSFAERHFLVMWAYQGFASTSPGVRLGTIDGTALQGYKLIVTDKCQSHEKERD